MNRLRAACVQVNATDDMPRNLRHAADFARAARDDGATLIAFPENVAMMSFGGARVRAAAYPQDDHPGLSHFQALAKELEASLLAGSLHVSLPGEDRVANRSFAIDPAGRIVAAYDKLHMFDVDLADGESYRESGTFRAGDTAVLADVAGTKLGLSICYDLRFPHLYRRLAKAGAQILSVPAAFTRQTGQAHWHVLLRARAIETGCFVLAPGQCGAHPGDRETFGHSLIIGPWGEVLADGGEEPGIITADLDLDAVARAQGMIPALSHDRDFRLLDA